jgi:pyridoxal phosphate enzyme (YggS family)
VNEPEADRVAVETESNKSIDQHRDLVAEVAARAAEVNQRIDQASSALSPDSRRPVTVVAVTKTFPLSYLEAAVAAGLPDVGENYAQDLVAKADEAVEAGIDCRMHFIGGLQRNKVKLLAGKVWLWQTIDRQALIDRVAERDPGARILIQVNTTDEPQKSGCAPTDTAGLVEYGRQAGLRVEGLMTIGPTGGVDPRPAFELLRSLRDGTEVEHLSMGMSGDYEQAVAEGATMVRIGSALFGSRDSR